MGKIGLAQGLVSMMIFDRFHAKRPLDKAEWRFQMPGVCADAQYWRSHGSKNLLQRVILYRHKKIYVSKGRQQASTCETICTFVMVICKYLWINVFVWALVFCGIRYCSYVFKTYFCSVGSGKSDNFTAEGEGYMSPSTAPAHNSWRATGATG